MGPIRGSMKQNEDRHRSEACRYTSCCLMKSTLQCLQTVPSLVALSKSNLRDCRQSSSHIHEQIPTSNARNISISLRRPFYIVSLSPKKWIGYQTNNSHQLGKVQRKYSVAHNHTREDLYITSKKPKKNLCSQQTTILHVS
jgi:hypothetical protein